MMLAGSIFILLFYDLLGRGHGAQDLDNVTRTISNLLQGYDIRLRPNFGGKSGIRVTAFVTIVSSCDFLIRLTLCHVFYGTER